MVGWFSTKLCRSDSDPISHCYLQKSVYGNKSTYAWMVTPAWQTALPSVTKAFLSLAAEQAGILQDFNTENDWKAVLNVWGIYLAVDQQCLKKLPILRS